MGEKTITCLLLFPAACTLKYEYSNENYRIFPTFASDSEKKDENEDFYSNASWDVDLSFVVRQRQNLISEDEERTEKGNRSVYQQSRD